MNANQLVQGLTPPAAVIAGLLICFLGYRLLKVSLGLIGFVAAAAGGWSFGLSMSHENTGVGLICAIVAGLVGAALCVWLFFLGIFLVGAAAGAIVAAAFFNASGSQLQPMLVLVFSVVFGFIAIVMQKFMIIASTALSGSYLIVSGLLHLLAHSADPSLLWFNRPHAHSPNALGYAALGAWIALALAGLSVQYRHHQRREESARREEKPRPAQT